MRIIVVICNKNTSKTPNACYNGLRIVPRNGVKDESNRNLYQCAWGICPWMQHEYFNQHSMEKKDDHYDGDDDGNDDNDVKTSISVHFQSLLERRLAEYIG